MLAILLNKKESKDPYWQGNQLQRRNLPGENIPSPSLLDHPMISLIFLSVICSMRTNTGAISYVNLEWQWKEGEMGHKPTDLMNTDRCYSSCSGHWKWMLKTAKVMSPENTCCWSRRVKTQPGLPREVVGSLLWDISPAKEESHLSQVWFTQRSGFAVIVCRANVNLRKCISASTYNWQSHFISIKGLPVSRS